MIDVAAILSDADRAHRPPETRSQWFVAPCGHLTSTGYHKHEDAPGHGAATPECDRGRNQATNHQIGAPVMTSLSDTDARIDAALAPKIEDQEWAQYPDGSRVRLSIINVCAAPEVHVLREDRATPDGTEARGHWTVSLPSVGATVNTDGDFESTAAARMLASALIYAATLADRLEEDGR